MKKLLPLILLTTTNLFGAIGCVDNSYHLKDTYYQSLDPDMIDPNAFYRDIDERPLDSKSYHSVYNCTCPCNEYVITEDRGFCTKCRHFGNTDRKSIQNTRDASESELDQFALLKKVIDERKARETSITANTMQEEQDIEQSPEISTDLS
jgi:hypothetical protein